ADHGRRVRGARGRGDARGRGRGPHGPKAHRRMRHSGNLLRMSEREFLFTSESVTEGHPDKVADQVSDAVLDAVLSDDSGGRVACETLVTTGLVVVGGEMTTETYVDVSNVVRETIRGIGYTDSAFGFDANTCGVVVAIDPQSPDIAQGVDASYEVQHDPGE